MRIYFHSDCFDGAASAALAAHVLSALGDIEPQQVSFSPVTYHVRRRWAGTPVRPFAVVDFLFHPVAEFWADHHDSTFVSDEFDALYRANSEDFDWAFDPRAPSCAEIIWSRYRHRFGASLAGRLHPLVEWASKIDGARYDSVADALFSEEPAMMIARWLSQPNADSVLLAQWLRDEPLDRVADHSLVRAGADRALTLLHRGQARISEGTEMTDDEIVVFDLDNRDGAFNRYLPFHQFPQARYSVGVLHLDEGPKVTVMRNPWRAFPSAALGSICGRFGGGGHHRVGSVLTRNGGRVGAVDIVNGIIGAIRAAEERGELAEE